MCSDFVLRSYIIIAVATLTLDSAAAKERKCVYMFNMCISCEAPLTCRNSRPVASKSRPAATRRPKAARFSSPRPKVSKKPISGQSTRRTEFTNPAINNRVVPQSRSTTHFDREFREFEDFMREQRANGSPLDDRMLQEMYFTYRLWLSKQAQGKSKPVTN